MSNKVSDDFVERYKCDICKGALSRGPIHKIEGEKYHCGRCQPSDGQGIRIKILEDLAQGMLFPCQYKANGCQASIAFEENQTHEESCPFNPNAPSISVLEELVAGLAVEEPSNQATNVRTTQRYGTERMKIVETTVQCNRDCNKIITKQVYQTGWKCPIHAPPRGECARLGCPFKDIDVKCKKHMDYYCGGKCPICDADVTGMTLQQHYTSMHGHITWNAGTAHTVSYNNQWQYIIVQYKFGKVVCRYQMRNGHFQLKMYSPLHSEQFYVYPAQVQISHPVTGRILRCAPIVEYNETYDWYLDIPLTRLSEFTHDSQVIIKLISSTSDIRGDVLYLCRCKLLSVD